MMIDWTRHFKCLRCGVQTYRQIHPPFCARCYHEMNRTITAEESAST